MWLSGVILFIGTSYFIICFLRKSFSDNRKTKIDRIEWLRTTILTLIVYIPIVLLLIPGIYMSFWIDDKIEQGVQWAYKKTENKIEQRQIEIEEIKREPIAKRWYNPMDWVRGGKRYVERKVIIPVQEEVITRASVGVRIAFSLIISLLRLSQFLFYITTTYVFLRSFLFAFSRALLYGGTVIRFNLPHG